MAIWRLNHAVLFVRHAEASARFYCDVLGFRRVEGYSIPGAVFLRAEGSTNDHDLGLFSVGMDSLASQAGRRAIGLYHLAWEVETLADLAQLARRLADANALVGAADHGTTRALYGRDPDGIEFELTWVVPLDQLGAAKPTTKPLDLSADIERFGPHTLGGVGVSRPKLS